MGRDPKNDELKDRYDYAHAGWYDFLRQAEMAMEMHGSAQWSREEVASAQRTGRSLYTFNKIARQVNLLSGYEIRNRHTLKVSPIGREDDDIARQHTALIMQQLSTVRGYDMMSDAFKWGSLVSGSNILEMYRDRDGFFRFARHGYNQFLLDPGLAYTDLSDCGFYLTGRWLSRESIKSLLPEDADKINKIPAGSGAPRWSHGQEHHFTQNDKKSLMEEYWHRDIKTEEFVLSRMTSQEIRLDELVDRFNGDRNHVERLITESRLPDGRPALSKFSKGVPTIKLSVFVDSELVFDGDNPLGLDDYNVVWFPGEWTHEVSRSDQKLRSFAMNLLDPQRAKNRRINQSIDIIESQLTAYKVLRENALANPEEAWQSGQGKVIIVKERFQGPLQDAFYQGSASDIPPGMFQLLQAIDKEEIEVSGMNDEIFGSDSKDIPGILGRQRTGAALTGHQGIFQGFRSAKQQLGKKMLKANQIWQDPSRVQRMINEPPVQGFYDDRVSDYDCVPVEGTLTDTQQMMFYQELKELKALYPDAAQSISIKDLISAAPIQGKRELLKAIEEKEKQAQQQQQKVVEDERRINNLVEAQTASQIARAKEDISDIQENRANIQLKNVQAVAELADIPRNQMLDLMERVANIENVNAQRDATRRVPSPGATKKSRPRKKTRAK